MKAKVLFVDDDPMVLAGFKAMFHLRRKEFQAAFALSGEEGLLLLDSADFDVIVADMRMPGMNGADFLAEAARRAPTALRVILSGYSEMDVVLRSVKPAHQFLSKPCKPDVLFGTITRILRLRHILTNEAVQQVVGRIESLPALPELYLKIQQALTSPDPSLKTIGALVGQDMGMSASVLKVVNSSFFGFYNKIISPAHAVNLLGVEVMKGLVLGIQFIKRFDLDLLPGYSLHKVWGHCLQTGTFARALARREGKDDDFADACFIAGLLHDVGKLVLASEMPDDYRLVLHDVKNEGGGTHRFELARLGVSHQQIGAYLLGLWGMSMAIVEAVYAHHEPALAGPGVTPGLLVHVADRLQHELIVYDPGYVFAPLDADWIETQGLAHRVDAWRETCKTLLTEHPHGQA